MSASADSSVNRLIREKSPYLLQHARNPVDWFPWGNEAFSRARREEKLIFLSVGYSTCHWCHVMAHESFEDPEVAEALARNYVAVKVDREERPDIDQVYMEFCQRLTGRGGWPLTVVLMPDGLPVFAATYLPKMPRPGYAGLIGLLDQVAEQARTHEARLREAGQQLLTSMQPGLPAGTVSELPPRLFEAAFHQLRHSFDPHHGGFGSAPKFPNPHHLRFLLRYGRTSDPGASLPLVEKTLEGMAAGGIYDQLGGGFHRYATDSQWLLPHFEKMLYDQAGLAEVYLEAFAATGREDFSRVAADTLDYVLRELVDPTGGFHAAEDADSEGEEGLFYLWRRDEIEDLLDAETAETFCRAYGVVAEGNYRDEASGRRTGRNILHRPVTGAALAADLELAPPLLAKRLDQAREVLREQRRRRPPPHRDDKILTAWNGLLITALAKGARILGRPGYLAAAERCADFVLTTLRREDGRLLRRWREGEAGIPAFAEDYAFLARGLLDLHRTSLEPRWLMSAVQLAEEMQRLFAPPDGGALYDTGSDGDALVTRPRTLYDGAHLSANSAAIEVFARLFLLSGEPAWERRAGSILAQLLPLSQQTPQGFTGLLGSALLLAGSSRDLVIVGEADAPDTRALIAVTMDHHDPGLNVLLAPPGDTSLATFAPFTAAMTAIDHAATAYLCQGRSCLQPTNDPEILARYLLAP